MKKQYTVIVIKVIIYLNLSITIHDRKVPLAGKVNTHKVLEQFQIVSTMSVQYMCVHTHTVV